MIWQVAKIYAKLKRRLSPRVCHLDLVKIKHRPTKITDQLMRRSSRRRSSRRTPRAAPSSRRLIRSRGLQRVGGHHLLRPAISFICIE